MNRQQIELETFPLTGTMIYHTSVTISTERRSCDQQPVMSWTSSWKESRMKMVDGESSVLATTPEIPSDTDNFML